jgi:uncharacterized membrane protein
MSTDVFSPDNVLVVTFGDDSANDSNAYQALTNLEQLDSQGQIKVASAAVVTRDDGHVHVKSEVGNDSYLGTASGGLIGLVVGIIGGPLGVLLGGTYGALVGSLFDLDDDATTDSVLGEIAKQVQPDRTVMLAQVTEQSPEVIDTVMARLGGDVMRRPTFEVEQEIAAAQDAQRKAEREARAEVRKARLEKSKDDAHAKVEELKSKLHRTKAGAAS